MQLKASIDIGTNSTRLLFVQTTPDGKILPVDHFERLTKLGAGLDRDNNLSRDAMLRVVNALAEFREMIDDFAISDVRVFATSATRDANNRDAFLSLISEGSGFACRVLSGDEEARFSFLGVISDLAFDDPFMVCDVGGGSAEFIFAKGKQILSAQSLNVGSGRLTRDFLRHDPPTAAEKNNAVRFVDSQLRQVTASPSALVCVGGTAATLAMIDAGVAFEKPKAAHHYRLEKSRLDNIIALLADKTTLQRQQIPGLHPERADVILGGALIYQQILSYFSIDFLITSLKDLMLGIFLE